jgi:RimJ/RimL family protein N-acetyltransferase
MKKIKLDDIKIYGETIYLRELNEDDASLEYCSWLNDPLVNKFLETKKTTMLGLRQYIKEKRESKNCLFLGIFAKDNHKHIGNIKLEPIDFERKTAMLGVLIGDKSYWEKGICTETVTLVVDYSFNHLHLNKIELSVLSQNKAAIRCYEKAGLTIEKTEGNLPDKTRFIMNIKKDQR